MAVPKYYEMQKPILVFLADVGSHNIKELRTYVAKHFQLKPEDMEELSPNGKHNLFGSRISWACTYPVSYTPLDVYKRQFDVADQYRNPVIVMGDGMIGQMMEPVEMHDYKPRELPPKTWATTGWSKDMGIPRRIINSLYVEADVLEKHVAKRMQKYAEIERNECMVEEQFVDDADIIIAAYGTTARICLTAVRQARAAGIKCGLIRPITVWPFPSANYRKAAEPARAMLCVEMSCGQMIDDVRIAVAGKCPVSFFCLLYTSRSGA